LGTCPNDGTGTPARPPFLLDKLVGKAVAVWTAVMLKITTHKQKNKTRLVVEGRLTASTIGILERCWQEAHTPQIEIEFMDIMFVDESAKKLLKRLATAGVKFFAHDVQMNAVIETIQKSRKEEREL